MMVVAVDVGRQRPVVPSVCARPKSPPSITALFSEHNRKTPVSCRGWGGRTRVSGHNSWRDGDVIIALEAAMRVVGSLDRAR